MTMSTIPILETAEEIEAHLKKHAPVVTVGEDVTELDAPIPYAMTDCAVELFKTRQRRR